MKIAIVITTPDFAGLNIKERLLEKCQVEKTGRFYDGSEILKVTTNNNESTAEIYTTDTRCIALEHIEDSIDADLFIIPTTHRSAADKRTLSCHTQGNWGVAELGGTDCNLSVAPSFYLKKALITLTERCNSKGLDYEPTLEVTHHGPDIERPTIFLEIGSTEAEWKDRSAAAVIAEVIMDLIAFNPDTDEKAVKWKSAIGIGGPHYCTGFNKLMLDSDYAIGHVCPKYMLESLSPDMVRQAISKTFPKPELAILDWKGLGAEKGKIIAILDTEGIAYDRIERLRKQ